MSAQKFYKLKAIGLGVAQVLLNLKFFAGVFLLASLVVCFLGYMANVALGVSLPLASVLFLLTGIACVFFILGLLKVSFNLSRERGSRFSVVFSRYRLFLNYLVALISYLLIVLGGLILFIVPGVYWGIKFGFFPYFIIDKRVDPIEALNRSSRLVDGVRVNLFFLYLLLALFASIAIAAILGLAFVVVTVVSAIALTVALDTAVVYSVGKLIFAFSLVFGGVIIVPVFMVTRAFVYGKLVSTGSEEEVSPPSLVESQGVDEREGGKEVEKEITQEVIDDQPARSIYGAAGPVLREHLGEEHGYELAQADEVQLPAENQSADQP